MPMSTKELNYVRDHLSWELLMAKACRDAANQAPDQRFRQLFDEAGGVHQRNYEDFMTYLQSAQGGKGGAQL